MNLRSILGTAALALASAWPANAADLRLDRAPQVAARLTTVMALGGVVPGVLARALREVYPTALAEPRGVVQASEQ